jgi:hypothetical protein
MTHGDTRGPNIIPFGKRSLAALRRRNIDRPAPPERPWPFNCLMTPAVGEPYYTLPPVDAIQFGRACPDGVRLPPDDTFSFRGLTDAQFSLELGIEGALADYQLVHPETTPLEFVTAFLRITKKLLRLAKLPPR